MTLATVSVESARSFRFKSFRYIKVEKACKNSRLGRFARRGEGSSRRQFSQVTLKSVIKNIIVYLSNSY